MTELLKAAFTDFYRLDFDELFWLLVVATGCFLTVHERFKKKNGWRIFLAVAVLGCTVLVVYSTVGSRGEGTSEILHLIPFHSYREIWSGGNPEIYRSNFMNAVLFYPAGLLAAALLPEKWPGWCKCVLVMVVFGLLSAGIEYVQYTYALGRCEIDDVIHNTAGALAGSLAALLMPPLLVWIEGKGKLMWK